MNWKLEAGCPSAAASFQWWPMNVTFFHALLMSGAAACVAAVSLVTTYCHVNLKKEHILSAPPSSPPLPPPYAFPSQHPLVGSHRLHQTFNPNSIRLSAFPLLPSPPFFPSLRYIPTHFSLFSLIFPFLPSLSPSFQFHASVQDVTTVTFLEHPHIPLSCSLFFPPRLMIPPQTENSDHTSPWNTSVVSAHIWNL